ncbi:type II secretion system protein GspL [Alcanivorax sp. DP30]|uniref:type II secretion system protein GspL n=1 Tax=Alcanivorax sp. DP30 TaxID=2606217 RepID=UPI00136E6A9D|nr:general secretion pathway protein GspL [Alcanivorax sp. DP30]
MSQAPLIYLYDIDGLPVSGATQVLFQADSGSPVISQSLDEAFSEAAMRGQLRLVLSAPLVRLTQVTLSRKQARHLDRVMPYLLEENLLDSPDSLFFNYRKGEGDEYLVTAIEQSLVTTLLDRASDAGADLQTVEVDIECLAGSFPLIVGLPQGQSLLASSRDSYLIVDEERRQSLVPLFGDSLDHATEIEAQEALFDLFRQHRGQQLLTGVHAPRKNAGEPGLLAEWRPLLILAASILVLAIIGLRVQAWRYDQAAEAALADAKGKYEQLFPGDKATSALIRQFQSRLSRLSSGGGSAGTAFFPMLVPVAEVLRESKVEPKRLQYDQRQNSLLLDVGAKDYAQLEALQNALRDQGAKASIANYRNAAQGVNARIKVEQPG